MSNISIILEKLKGTRQEEILLSIENSYKKIDEEQKLWYEKAKFFCPTSCGKCCHHFEPDLLEAESLYMAAWLLENSEKIAEDIIQGKFPFKNGDTCPFHDFENPLHCIIYDARPSICRLFGASCFKDKNSKQVWKPCKFFPLEELQKYSPLIFHKQYSKEETAKILGKMPPLMSDLMEEIVLLNTTSSKTQKIKDILPTTIQKLKWLCQINN